MRADLPPGPSYPSLIQGIGFWTRPIAFLERAARATASASPSASRFTRTS